MGRLPPESYTRFRGAPPGEAGGTGGCTGAHPLPLLLVVCCSGFVGCFGPAVFTDLVQSRFPGARCESGFALTSWPAHLLLRGLMTKPDKVEV